MQAPPEFKPSGDTHADDPLLLYFTSGTTAKPKLVLHSHRSYAVGHLSGMYWLGLQPGDVHLNISSPGWAKHAWSSFFIPWIAEATAFVLNQPRFSARTLLEAITTHGVTTICAPPTVWRMVIQEDLRQWKTSLREVCSAGEPLNPEVIEQVRAAWDLTIRDGYGQTETTLQIGNPPGLPIKLGSMGKPMPGYLFELATSDGRNVDEGEISIPLDKAPVGLMRGYQNGSRSPKPGEGLNGAFLSYGIQGLSSRGRADPFEQLQDPKPGYAINRVLGPPQDGKHVLHMGGFNEFEAAEFDEGDVPARQLDLQHGAVMRGSEQDRLILQALSRLAVGENG